MRSYVFPYIFVKMYFSDARCRDTKVENNRLLGEDGQGIFTLDTHALLVSSDAKINIAYVQFISVDIFFVCAFIFPLCVCLCE
jgi:hypothetical protein